jgi:fatty-acyl-CoA synthase
MVEEELHRPLYMPDILVNALSTDHDRPMLHLLDGPTLNVGQVRDATSQFMQALASLGVGKGTRVGLLAPNLPEVLHVSHAVQLLGAVYIPLHPLSGLPDQQYVIADSGVEILIFDAQRYGGRAAEIAAGAKGLRLVAFGETPLGEDLTRLAATFKPMPLVAPQVGPHDVMRLGYSGGTTGKPKALASVQRSSTVTLQLMMTD